MKNKKRTPKHAVRARASQAPTGYVDVRLNKGEVLVLKYALKKHANEIRDSASEMMRMANYLENFGDHVEKLLEP
jgi:hypothetical protein